MLTPALWIPAFAGMSEARWSALPQRGNIHRIVLDFNPIRIYSHDVLLIEGRHLEASDGGAGCGARGRASQSTHPGGAGAPPGGQYGLPARSLADGGRLCLGRPRKARPGAVRKTPANKPGLRKLVRVARRAAPRISARECGHTKNNGCAPWRAIPLIFEGRQREDGPTRGLAKQYG